MSVVAALLPFSEGGINYSANDLIDFADPETISFHVAAGHCSDNAQIISNIHLLNGQRWFSYSDTVKTHSTLQKALALQLGISVRQLNTNSDPDGLYVDLRNVATSGLTPQSFANTRKALARVRSAAGRLVINCIGDSTTVGVGAGTGGSNDVGAFPKAFPQRVADILTKQVAAANCDSIWGRKNVSSITGYDARIALGADWTTAGPVSIGHFSFKGVANGSTTLDFSPANQFDRITVWWLRNGSQAIPTVGVDGGGAITPATTVGSDIHVNIATYNVTRGTHVINLKPGTGDTYVVGCEAWDSTAGQISVRNMGWSGSASADWNSTADYKAPLTALAAVPADLTLICLGINDWTNNGLGGVGAFNTNMQAMITAIKGYGGDIALVTPTASDPTLSANTAQPVQNQYLAAMSALAASNSIPLLNWNLREGPYTAANGLGMMTDQRHPNAIGYADKAQLVARAIMRA